jgi:hypothetical protein
MICSPQKGQNQYTFGCYTNCTSYYPGISSLIFSTIADSLFITSLFPKHRTKNEDFDIILRRRLRMVKKAISGSTVHKLPKDLREALTSDSQALPLWEGLTPLARNEWIYWVTFVKKDETRKEHVQRTVSELKEGMRRLCCWLGCIHRTDKAISPSVQYVLSKKSKSVRTG